MYKLNIGTLCIELAQVVFTIYGIYHKWRHGDEEDEEDDKKEVEM